MTPTVVQTSCRSGQPILRSSLAGEALQIGPAMNLAVDVISDVICPWCYIGKKRLEKAIAAFDGKQEVRVRWLPLCVNTTNGQY
jgi:hypothetical protein